MYLMNGFLEINDSVIISIGKTIVSKVATTKFPFEALL